MPKICYLCNYRQKKGDFSVAMHRFPKDAKTRSEWFKFCELTEGVDQVSCITICSLHFTADDFNFPKLGCKGAKILSLKSGAIPSVRIGGKKQHKTKAFTNDSNTESLCMTDLNDLDLNLGNYNCDNGETDDAVLEQFVLETNSMYLNLQDCVSSTEQELLQTYAAHSTELSPADENLINEAILLEKEIQDTPLTDCNFQESCDILNITEPCTNTTTNNEPKKPVKTRKKRKYISLQEQNRYLRRKVADLKELVNNLKKRDLVAHQAVQVVTDGLPPTLKHMVSRKKKHKYSDEVRDFSVKLHFISPKAYDYVRKYWHNLLPHPATVREWYPEPKETENNQEK